MKNLIKILFFSFILLNISAFGEVDYNVFDSITKEKGINKPVPFKFFTLINNGKTVTFDMGYKYGEWDEKPVHTVTLTKPLNVQETEVTQLQWSLIMGTNPSKFKGDNLPVETVSYYDVKKFIQKINQLDTKYEYRLPTEAEWEYFSGPELEDRKDLLYRAVWYEKKAENTTHPVGTKVFNVNRLRDTLGNVMEWVEDTYDKKAYSKLGKDQKDPLFTGTSDLEDRVIRGCGFGSPAEECRVCARFHNPPDFKFEGLGFRLVREAK